MLKRYQPTQFYQKREAYDDPRYLRLYIAPVIMIFVILALFFGFFCYSPNRAELDVLIRQGNVRIANARRRIQEQQQCTWDQFGQTIFVDHVGGPGYLTQQSMVLSTDGNTLAVGSPGGDVNKGSVARKEAQEDGENIFGYVRIYTREGVLSQWKQMGEDIPGETEGDYSGAALSLSSNGQIVAIGDMYNIGNNEKTSDAYPGHVRVYGYNGVTSKWIQIGQDLDGEAIYDMSGMAISLSSDGKTLAIGTSNSDENFGYSGHVRIYTLSGTDEWNKPQWETIGQDIGGKAYKELLGSAVSLSYDGQTVAIGAPSGVSDDRGLVRIYTLTGLVPKWTQLGLDIQGEAAYDASGRGSCLLVS